MARKRKSYKSKRTKRYKKKFNKKKFGKATVSATRSGTLIAERFFTKLKYSQRVDLTPAGSATESYVFSGNSVFDPDATGSGSQPLGYDQWSSFYNKYRVRASKITVNAVATSGSHFPVKISIYPQDDNATATGIENAAARPYSKTSITSGYGGPRTFLKNFMTSKKQLGVKSINEETGYASAISGSPSLRWYWCISIGTLDAVTSIAGLYADIEVTYYVEFYDIVDLVLS